MPRGGNNALVKICRLPRFTYNKAVVSSKVVCDQPLFQRHPVLIYNVVSIKFQWTNELKRISIRIVEDHRGMVVDTVFEYQRLIIRKNSECLPDLYSWLLQLRLRPFEVFQFNVGCNLPNGRMVKRFVAPISLPWTLVTWCFKSDIR